MDRHDQPEGRTNTRRYPRYELDTELRVAILGLKRSEVRGRSLNVNQGGIGGIFAKGWEIGTSVNVQFSVPFTSTPVRVRGILRNRIGYRYGFEFLDLTPDQREILGRICATLSLLQ